MSTGETSRRRAIGSGWITDGSHSFNDDSAWWGLGWIRARDVMGNIEYLNTAIDVWNYINAHRSTDCPGGVLWNPGDSSSTAVNAISNCEPPT